MEERRERYEIEGEVVYVQVREMGGVVRVWVGREIGHLRNISISVQEDASAVLYTDEEEDLPLAKTLSVYFRALYHCPCLLSVDPQLPAALFHPLFLRIKKDFQTSSLPKGTTTGEEA